MGYKTGAITYEFETKTFNYDRGIRLFADVMDVDEKCEASHFSSTLMKSRRYSSLNVSMALKACWGLGNACVKLLGSVP